MKKLSVLVAGAMLVVACGGGADDAVETTSGAAVSTTAVAEATTTAAEPTTSMAETSTTAAAETTTTGATADAKGLDVLLRNVGSEGAEVTSARIEGSMSIEGAVTDGEGPMSFEVPFTTVFDTVSGDFAVMMDMSAMGDMVPESEDPLAAQMLTQFEIRQIGEDAYVRMPFLAAMLGSDAEWIRMPADESDTFTGDMGVQTDPFEMLDTYREANAQVEELGTEEVNGVEATHYRVVVDSESYLASLSDEERAQIEAEGPMPQGEFPLDLWITDDGFIVKMLMEIDGSEVDFDANSTETFERMTLTYDVFDINQPVEISAPDDYAEMDDLGGFGGDQG